MVKKLAQLICFSQMILVLLFISIHGLAGCGIFASNSRFNKKNKGIATINHKAEINIKSIVTSTNQAPMQWSINQLNPPIEVRRFDFISAEIGYISDNKKSLYKTIDGGRTWGQVNIAISNGLEISSLSFVDARIGWVALRSVMEEPLHKQIEKYTPIRTWLMQTRDGGSSWEILPSAISLVINNVRFVDEQEGWAWGTRLYHTNDQGRHWEDVTESLCRVSPHDHIDNCVFHGFYSQGSEQMTALTDDLSIGGLITTLDAGKSWQLITKVKLSSFGYTEPVRIKLSPDNGLWLVASSDSKEGMWGELIHISDKSVVYYNLQNVITDIAFLSNRQILGCGYIYPNEIPRDSEKSIGVIFNSIDGGHTWEIIYRNSKVRSINAMEAIDSRNILAIGKGGEILKLEYKENK